MTVPTLAQIQSTLRAEADRIGALPRLNLTVLRNVTVEVIEPYLRYFGYRAGFDLRPTFGGFDNIVQEAIAAPALLGESTDCVVVAARLEGLSWDLARRFAALSPEEIAREIARIHDFTDRVIDGIRAQTNATILWVGFEQPVRPALGILDYQRKDGQTDCVVELNRFVRERLVARRSAYLVDPNPMVARVGAGAFYDQRYWHLAKAPYSRAALQELAAELVRYLSAVRGKSKKCLILDCDNVLWGGVIGEDGMAGIALGKTHPGSAFVEFQYEVLNLHARGVILAICSKNNEPDVWEVFSRHPDMVLRREHIAAARIDWSDKVSNLRALARTLNIGLDSCVFLDDSGFEIGQVQAQLPEVTAVQLPVDRPGEYRDVLLAGGWFDTLSIGAEDRARGAMYQAEASRQELLTRVGNLEEYYRTLEMVLEIRSGDSLSIPRIAQLTQKTNQFNLTTRRYTEAEIAALCQSDSADVVSVRLRDRYGDSGLTGVCIIRYQGDRARLDTLLLSCRVLGRGVEDAFLVRCLRLARARGCRIVLGEYLPTSKNGQVRDFYSGRGFTLTTDQPDRREFELDLLEYRGEEPAFFHRIESDLEDGPSVEARTLITE